MQKVFFVFCLFGLFVSSCSGIKRGKEYKIGIDPSWYPLQVEGLKKNVSAYVQEILLEIAEEKNVRFFLVRKNKDQLLLGLQKKEYDAVFSSLYPYIFDQKKYQFSDVFLLTGPALVTKKNVKEAHLEEFDGKLIGIVQGDPAIFLLEKYRDILIKEYPTIADVLLDVFNGYLDAALVNILEGKNFIKNIYDQKLKITDPLTEEGLRLISLKEEKEIISFFNTALQELQRNGKLEKIQKKWSL